MATTLEDTPKSGASVPTGFSMGGRLLHDPMRNKGTAFSEAEREASVA